MYSSNANLATYQQSINILLIDDDEDDFIITRNLLKESGGSAFNIDWISNYSSAKQAIAINDYDVYLLDYHLGSYNGIDLLREAVQNGCKKPFIMLTGKGNSEIDFQALRAGAADFLNKGYIDSALLERSIRYSMEQKRIERELADEKERLAVTLRSIGDGVITTDSHGKIELINKTAEMLTGWTSSEAISKSIDTVFKVVSDKTHEKEDNPVVGVLKSKRPSELFEHTILIKRDGKEYNVISTASPILDKDNKLLGVILVFRDITKLLKMQAELQKTQKLESLGLLAGGIAHDFNNLLTIINGNVELTKMNIDSKQEILENLGTINKATNRAKGLTDQFLTFAKSGILKIKTTSVINLIEESVVLGLSGSNITSELSFQEGLTAVDIDAGQISQVLNNLILNAKQAMPETGKIKISAENVNLSRKKIPNLKQGKYVKISIRDQGKGIPKENLTKIFDPYFTTKQMNSIKGTGLGLSTAYSIIKNHNGLITVDSKVNRGTIFSIYLPASRENVQPRPLKNNSIKLSRKKILLVEDNKALRETVVRVLSNNGHDVVATQEGKVALKLIASAKEQKPNFDIVILDLTLPGEIGGEDLIQRIHKIAPEIKAVISSGHTRHPTMIDFKKHGFDAAICKPYRVNELIEALANI